MSSETKDIIENINRLARKRAALRKRGEDVENLEGLMRFLPQGEGSGLDADKVDGMHAKEIIEEARKGMRTTGGGGGGTGGVGMTHHGNEWHTPNFGVPKESHITLVAVAQEISF